MRMESMVTLGLRAVIRQPTSTVHSLLHCRRCVFWRIIHCVQRSLRETDYGRPDVTVLSFTSVPFVGCLSVFYQPSASTNLSCWCKFLYMGIDAFSTLTFHYHLNWLAVNQYNCFLVRFAQYFRRSPDYKRTTIIMWSHVSLSIVRR